ncbi:MAG: DUF4116 domain-containing protein [Chlamydia sp.]
MNFNSSISHSTDQSALEHIQNLSIPPPAKNISEYLKNSLKDPQFNWQNSDFLQLAQSATSIEEEVFDQIAVYDRSKFFTTCPNIPILIECNNIIYSIAGHALFTSEYFRGKIESAWSDGLKYVGSNLQLSISIETSLKEQEEAIALFLNVLSGKERLISFSLEQVQALLAVNSYLSDSSISKKIDELLCDLIHGKTDNVNPESLKHYSQDPSYINLHDTLFQLVFSDYELPKSEKLWVELGAQSGDLFKNFDIEKNGLLKKYGTGIKKVHIELNSDFKNIHTIFDACKNIETLSIAGDSSLKLKQIPFPEALQKIIINGCSIYSKKNLEMIGGDLADFKEKSITDPLMAREALRKDPMMLFYIQDAIRGSKECLFHLMASKIEILCRSNLDLEKSAAFMLFLISIDPASFMLMSSELQSNQKFIEKALSINSKIFEYIDQTYRNNPEFIQNCVQNLRELKNRKNIYKNMDPALQNSTSFIEEMVNKHGIEILEYASDSLRNNQAFIFSFSKPGIRILRNIGISLQNDMGFIQEAILKWGPRVVLYASDEIQNNQEFILNFPEQEVEVLDYIGNNLRNDPIFIAKAIKKWGSKAHQYLNSKITEDKNIGALLKLRLKKLGKRLCFSFPIRTIQKIFKKIELWTKR